MKMHMYTIFMYMVCQKYTRDSGVASL